MEKHGIEYDGQLLTVYGCYNEEEPMVWRYANGDGYPGSPEYFEIHSVECDGESMDMQLSDWDLEQIESIILQQR